MTNGIVLLPLVPIGETPLYTKTGVLVAHSYTRVVVGGRGEYVEFSDEQMLTDNLHILPSQRWRLLPSWHDRIFYVEYRTQGNAMVYHQVRRVKYADYIPGMWYISPWDLFTGNGLPCAVGDPPKWKLD